MSWLLVILLDVNYDICSCTCNICKLFTCLTFNDNDFNREVKGLPICDSNWGDFVNFELSNFDRSIIVMLPHKASEREESKKEGDGRGGIGRVADGGGSKYTRRWIQRREREAEEREIDR